MNKLCVYGKKSFVKRVFSNPVKKHGFVELGIPNNNYDTHEEEL